MMKKHIYIVYYIMQSVVVDILLFKKRDYY